MEHGEETRNFENLLRKRGTDPSGNPAVEQKIEDRYRGLRAVLVLDSSGFTRITQEHGIIHFLSLVVAMRDIAQPLFERHGANMHWPEADNLYAVFPSAGQAVACAISLQQDVLKANTGRPQASRLNVCIGIGSGSLLCIGEENVYGDEMNVASKLGEDVAEPGEILMTQGAHGEAADVLKQHPELETNPREIQVSGVTIPYFAIQVGTA